MVGKLHFAACKNVELCQAFVSLSRETCHIPKTENHEHPHIFLLFLHREYATTCPFHAINTPWQSLLFI